MNGDIWENGSDFHYISEYPGKAQTPWDENSVFYYSGRQAILSLLNHLELSCQKLRIWLPAYYCSNVIDFLPQHNFNYYDCDPSGKSQLHHHDFGPSDVVLLNCYFGVVFPEFSDSQALRRQGVTIIEDHSHDPYSTLAFLSQADYCFASLRKTLPLPDGGVLWSPSGASTPTIPGNQSLVSIKRVAAMLAKRSYLRSEWPDKPLFRTWFIESEAEFEFDGVAQISAPSLTMLENFDVKLWRENRFINYKTFYNALADTSRIVFNPATADPMGILMLEESPATREELRLHLVVSNIYPAVLWPVDGRVPIERGELARDFAARSLFIHCDGRYVPTDMLRIANLINNFKVA